MNDAENAWSLVYEGYDPEQEGLREALCTLGNGYFATRGAGPEATADGVHYPGTYVAGCYNRLTDELEGRRITNESLVNVPNWLSLQIRLGDDWFSPDDVTIHDYRQELDLRRGLLTRLIRFTDAAGRTTRLVQRRLVSMADIHLAAVETTVVAEDWTGPVLVRSALDGRVRNAGVARYAGLANRHLAGVRAERCADDQTLLAVETTSSGIRVAESARTRVVNRHDLPIERSTIREPDLIAEEIAFELHADQPVTVEKVVSLYTSRDPAIADPDTAAMTSTTRAPGFESLRAQQILEWGRLWRRFAIGLHDGPEIARMLHLHIFHLLQTTSEANIFLDAGVPARGLHGEAYRGHVFWDELFVLPFLNLRMPEISKALLIYRYRRLDEARWAASQAGYAGAMFPWQSGSDGREESQQVHLNPMSGRWITDHSHLQRHIGSAIAYNVWRHYQATDDMVFLSSHGAEMILEVARFWASMATYDRSTDRYEITGVMGPDEYHDAYPGAEHPGLRNNAYTNVTAAWVLCRALELFDVLPDHRAQELKAELGINRAELDGWDHVSRRMRVCFHDGGSGRVISQFEGYEDLAELDWSTYRARHGESLRLDRILEAEGDSPNNYKASKQADVLMLFYLFTYDELRELFGRLGYPLDAAAIRTNVSYYAARTSHGSTLSNVVHAWVLSRLDREGSWKFFCDALRSDVADVQGGTTPEGIHLGAMVGTVDILQRCYAGISKGPDVLRLNPQLPTELERLEVGVRFRGQWLDLVFERREVRVSARPGPAATVRVAYDGDVHELAPGSTVTLGVP